MDGDMLALRLARRKYSERSTVLYRSCWFSSCKATCPVLVLWKFFAEFDVGQQPFKGFSAGTALSFLRNLFTWLDIPDSAEYRTHDLRRGHARDLQESGASLVEILQAGQWRSPAFLQYLDVQELEWDAVLAAHLNESSDDD